MDVRAALEAIVERRAGGGPVHATLIGQTTLVEEFERYRPIAGGRDLLISLASDMTDVAGLASTMTPDTVIVLCAGPSERLLRLLRTSIVQLTADLPARRWLELGYERRAILAFQGVASVLWAAAEKLCRCLGRDDWADRSRLAMLQCLREGARISALGAVQVHEYRRVA